MLEELLMNPLVILVLVGIFIMLIGITMASSAYPRFLQISEKYSDVPHSLETISAEVIAWGIKNLHQRTRLVALKSDEQGDFYVPKSDTICLTNKVYFGKSITDLAIASHEFGHSIQKNKNSFGTKICYILHLINNFLLNISWPLVFLGFIIYLIPFDYNLIGKVMIYVGIIGYFVNIMLKIALIPHEHNASTRAIKFLKSKTNLSKQEISQIREVLRAAGDTYIASLFYRPYRIIRFIFKGY